MSLNLGQNNGVWYRLAWIFALSLVGASIALFLTFLEKPLYEAHSSIEVGAECGNPGDNESFLATQTQLLESDSLFSAASQHFDPSLVFPRPTVERPGESHIIQIRLQTSNPQQSADFINALVDSYITDRALRLSAAWGSTADELKAANETQREGETRLQAFLKRNGLPASPKHRDLARLDTEVHSQYNALLRDWEERRRARDRIATRLKSVTVPSDSVRIVNRAEPSNQPVGRYRKLKTLAGLLIGGLLGFLVGHLLMPRRTPPQGTPEMDAPFWPSPRSFDYDYTAKQQHQQQQRPEETPRPATFDYLLETLCATARTKGHPILAVTSSGSGPTSAEMPLLLAAALVEKSSASVLVIDCDLAGAVTETVGLQGAKGLSEHLVSIFRNPAVLNAPVHATNSPGVSVMGTGTMPYRLPSMLSKFASRDTFAGLRDEYGFILLSAPPVLTSDEMRTLAPLVDGVVLVAPDRSLTEEAQSKIQNWGGHVLGITPEVTSASVPYDA